MTSKYIESAAESVRITEEAKAAFAKKQEKDRVELRLSAPYDAFFKAVAKQIRAARQERCSYITVEGVGHNPLTSAVIEDLRAEGYGAYMTTFGLFVSWSEIAADPPRDDDDAMETD